MFSVFVREIEQMGGQTVSIKLCCRKQSGKQLAPIHPCLFVRGTMLFEVWTITGQCLKSIRPKLVGVALLSSTH